jgi:hypothetical protein
MIVSYFQIFASLGRYTKGVEPVSSTISVVKIAKAKLQAARITALSLPPRLPERIARRLA